MQLTPKHPNLLLGLCLSFQALFFFHAQYITSSLKISKVPEWDRHFSLTPFSSLYQFPPLLIRIATQKQEVHKMFVVNLWNVFTKLETIVQTSSAAQPFGDTKGTFSTLVNNCNLLLFPQCCSTLALQLGFIHNLPQLHPPALAATLRYRSTKLRAGTGRKSWILKPKSLVSESTFSNLNP